MPLERRHVRRQLDSSSVLVVSRSRTRDRTSIRFATDSDAASIPAGTPASFSVSAITTITTSVEPSLSASAGTSSSSSGGSKTPTGLIAGLVVGFVVVIAGLIFLLLRCFRRKGPPRPPPQSRRATLIGAFPLPPSNASDEASHYAAAEADAEAEKGAYPHRTRERSRQASVASWFSASKSRLWRRTSVDRFAWYRSGLDDGSRLKPPPPPEMFERASPLTELTEIAALRMWTDPPPSRPPLSHHAAPRDSAGPALAHFSLSHDLRDSASINEKL